MELRHQHKHEHDVAFEKARDDRELDPRPRWPGKRTRTGAQQVDPRVPDLKRIRAAIGALRTDGKPLPGAMTREYSQLLGLDLADVRIHQGGAASAAAKSLEATAFTHGTDIAIADHLDLDSAFGRHVIAHELVHVAQNKRSGGGMDLAAHMEVGPSGSAIEQEAERGAAALTRGASFTVSAHSRLPGISRFGNDENPPTGAASPVPVPNTNPPPVPAPVQNPVAAAPTQPASAAPPPPDSQTRPAPQPRPTDQPAPATPQTGTPGHNQPSGSGAAPNPTTPANREPRPAATPRPQPAPTPAVSLEGAVQAELEKRADPTLKAGYAKAVAGVDSLRIQALQFTFTPNGVWNTLVETFTAKNAFQDHFGQIYSTNAYRGGASWVDTAQAWIEGLRGVVHIIGDVASVISAWAGLAALVTGALALILSETVIGGIALGAIAAIAAEVALVAGAIKLLTDIVDTLLGIIQMIILIVRARNSKDPAARARFAQLLHKEANDFGANVVSIGMQVAVMAVSAGIGAGLSRGANSFMSAFKTEFSKMITPALKPWTLGNNFRAIANMARPVGSGLGVATKGKNIFGNTTNRTVLNVEVEQSLLGISRLQRNALGRVTSTREVVPFTGANQMRGARLVTMRAAVGRAMAINAAGVKVGLGGGQIQADIKQPRNFDRGGTASSSPSGGGGRINTASSAGADLSKLQMWPSQIEAFENAKGPLQGAVDRTQRQYEMAETQAGPELSAQVRTAFQGANNSAGQMRFGAMQVQADATEGQANTQRGLQQTTQARAGQTRMGATQNNANASVQRISGEGAKLQSPPPKEGVLGWLYNQTIGRIGGWIGSAQKWVMNLVGKWAMSLAGFSKEEMDIAGIENDMREDDKKDATSSQEAQDAALKADQIQQSVFQLQENKTRDEQYAIQGMADAQRFIMALEDADRQLAAAVTNGQSYVQQVTPIIQHELQTEQSKSAIDAAYVAPVAAAAVTLGDSLDASNVGSRAQQQGNDALGERTAAYPDLDVGPASSAMSTAVGSYNSAFSTLVGQVRGQAAAVQTAIQAFIGTQDYDGVHANATALDALAADFDRAAQDLSNQLYAALNSTLTQVDAHIQRAIDEANQVPDENGATIPPQSSSPVAPAAVPQTSSGTTAPAAQPMGDAPAATSGDTPAPATPAQTPQPTGDADTPPTNQTNATATRAANVAARPGNETPAAANGQPTNAALNANQAAAAKATPDQPAAATQQPAATPAPQPPVPAAATTPQAQAPATAPRANRNQPDPATQTSPAVQRKAEGASMASAPVEVATRATEGGGGQLPHLDTIQSSFGHHDVSQVRAHDGDAARSGAAELGARAFAVGDAVAFASTPDLHTVAHEAAHVVQQRSGHAPSGGIDTPGDSLERHADAVADAVVAGGSAASILDQMVGGGAAAIGVQREAEDDKQDGTNTAENRAKALIDRIEKNFSRRPADAKQAATELAVEFPNLYTTDWLLGLLKQIDDAALKKEKMHVAEVNWDRRPAAAEDALRDLIKAFPKDAKLKKWCQGFLERIQIFQLTQQVSNWDRPGDAKKAAIELNRIKPGVYTKAWLAKMDSKIWTYQDAKWAERVNEQELREWVGANAVDWEEAPPAVKQELQILLGRMKRDQAFSAGGGGAKNAKNLAAPTGDGQRMGVLDTADDKIDASNPNFKFTQPQDIPAKKLEVTAKQLDKEAEQNEGLIQPTKKPEGFSVFREQPDVVTELLNKTFASRAEDLRESSSAYRALAQRLRNKETTIEAERGLMKRDSDALKTAIYEQNLVIQELETKGEGEEAAKLRKTVDALRKNRDAIEKVLSDPSGVVPGAGAIITMKDDQGRAIFPEWEAPSVSAVSKEKQQVKQVTDAIDTITGTSTGFENGIGKNFNEILVGVVRLSGRVKAVEAGVQRMITDVASYVLPESWTAAMRDVADTTSRTAVALKQAQSNITAENDTGRRMWEAKGGKLPLIDRVLSNEKIFESPDVAIFSILTALPTTKGAALIAQIGIAGIQAFEAFFSTYGQSGSLKDSLGAAGWTTLQNAAGIALGKLGLGAAGETAANVALTYGFGKLRGLSPQQIEEEIAFTLIGAGIGAATGAARQPIKGLASQAHEVVKALNGGDTEVAKETVVDKPISDDARSQKIDVAATDLQQAMVASRELTRALLEAQQSKKPTERIVDQLEQSNTKSKQKKTELRKLFAEEASIAPKTESQPVKQEPKTKVDGADIKVDALEAKLIERDARFKELFAENRSADSMSTELFLKGLERRASEARAKYPELAKLSDAELMAVIGYTTSDSVDINQGLRGDVSSGKINDAQAYAEVVTDALAKLPDQAGTFTRMVNYDAAILTQFVEGGFVQEPGFSSTSRLTSKELAQQSISGNTELVIHGKRGKQIDFLSKKGGEGEVLFPPDTTFRVDSVVKNGASTKIVLTEVQSPSGPIEIVGKPRASSQEIEAARKWADELANTKPEKMTEAAIAEDLAKYMTRKEYVEALYEKAMTDPTMQLPGGITREQLTLAVKGNKDGQRVPLTFSVENGELATKDVAAATKAFEEFKADLKDVFESEGITDAVVVQLGSGTTGWSTSPAVKDGKAKLGKAWSPGSDTDFAVFSDQAILQAKREGVVINEGNSQAGQYTTLKNGSKDGKKGFVETPLGRKLEALSKRWNKRIYGTEAVDGFDFKINLQTDRPFKSAIPVLQVESPPIVPLLGGGNGATHVGELPGRAGAYYGLAVKDPRVILPPDTQGRREYHITVLSPPELAALPETERAAIASGSEIEGAPISGQVVRHDIGDTPGFQLTVTWDQAQTFRQKLGLPKKELHVSLSGGIGEAITKRDAAKQERGSDEQPDQ